MHKKIDPKVNANWLVGSVLTVDGKKDGELADQVFQINTNGGQPPSGVRRTRPFRVSAICND